MKVEVTFIVTQEVNLPNKYFEKCEDYDEWKYLSEYRMTDEGLNKVAKFYPTVTCVEDMSGRTIAEF